jgi:uncharacterized protein YdeI (YjbR/CyaY-like superfamily)
MKQELYVSSRNDWRSWLKKNHARSKEIWLVYYKKHTGKPGISYKDSVEEALCFGWIDGIKKRIDEEKYTHRFTPRKLRSKWSELNVRLAGKMIEEGKMSPLGLAVFEQRLNYGDEFLEARSTKVLPLPTEIEDVLKRNKKAWHNFVDLAPGYRKQYILWLTTAKKTETREKRLKEAIRLLAENKKLGMK